MKYKIYPCANTVWKKLLKNIRKVAKETGMKIVRITYAGSQDWVPTHYPSGRYSGFVQDITTIIELKDM